MPTGLKISRAEIFLPEGKKMLAAGQKIKRGFLK